MQETYKDQSILIPENMINAKYANMCAGIDHLRIYELPS